MTTNQDKTIHVTENKQEFVPSVGQECEWCCDKNFKNHPKECVVLYKDETWFLVRNKNSFKETQWLENVYFRPLKTEAEIKRENSVSNMINVAEIGAPFVKDICKALYDAGYIKPRKLHRNEIISIARPIMNGSNTTIPEFINFARAIEKHIKGEA